MVASNISTFSYNLGVLKGSVWQHIYQLFLVVLEWILVAYTSLCIIFFYVVHGCWTVDFFVKDSDQSFCVRMWLVPRRSTCFHHNTDVPRTPSDVVFPFYFIYVTRNTWQRDTGGLWVIAPPHPCLKKKKKKRSESALLVTKAWWSTL